MTTSSRDRGSRELRSRCRRRRIRRWEGFTGEALRQLEVQDADPGRPTAGDHEGLAGLELADVVGRDAKHMLPGDGALAGDAVAARTVGGLLGSIWMVCAIR